MPSIHAIVNYDPIQKAVQSLAIDGQYLFVGMGDYRVEIWDWKKQSHVTSITQGLWEVRSIGVDEQFLYVGSLNEQVHIYDRNNFDLIEVIHHPQGITHLHTDSKFLYTCGYNEVVYVWNKSNLSLASSLEDHLTRSVTTVSSSSEIITGDGFMVEGASIRIWDKTDFSLIKQLSEPPSKRIQSLFLTEDRLFSAHGGPGEIRIWDRTSNYTLVTRLSSNFGDFIDVHVDDKFIFGVSRDKLYIWNQSTHELITILDEKGKDITNVKSQAGMLFYGTRDSVIMRNLTNPNFPISTIIEL